MAEPPPWSPAERVTQGGLPTAPPSVSLRQDLLSSAQAAEGGTHEHRQRGTSSREWFISEPVPRPHSPCKAAQSPRRSPRRDPFQRRGRRAFKPSIGGSVNSSWAWPTGSQSEGSASSFSREEKAASRVCLLDVSSTRMSHRARRLPGLYKATHPFRLPPPVSLDATPRRRVTVFPRLRALGGPGLGPMVSPPPRPLAICRGRASHQPPLPARPGAPLLTSHTGNPGRVST